MDNPFHNIDAAGITICSDGSPKYRDEELRQSSIDLTTGAGYSPELAPNQTKCLNPAACGANTVCTNEANCTGTTNWICNNRGNCDPKNVTNTLQCSDLFCSTCPKP
jgi:hypothetical protein